VRERTGAHAAVLIDGKPVASTLELADSTVPGTEEASTVDLPGDGDEVRAATVPREARTRASAWLCSDRSRRPDSRPRVRSWPAC
jgi:hypothetical protein